MIFRRYSSKLFILRNIQPCKSSSLVIYLKRQLDVHKLNVNFYIVLSTYKSRVDLQVVCRGANIIKVKHCVIYRI